MPSARRTRARAAAGEPPALGELQRAGTAALREGIIEIQRARILGAIAEVSVERGLGNTTVAHIVERAGVSRRTFYELYDGREDCFLSALEDGIARARARVLEGHDPRAPWLARIRTGLHALLSFLDVERDTARLLVVGSLGAGPVTTRRRSEVLAQLAAVVDEGRAEARGEGPPPLTAEGVVGGVLSVLHARLLGHDLSAPPGPGAVPGGGAASAARATSTGDASAGGASPPGGGEGARDDGSLLSLAGALTGMVVMPYLGVGAARRELARPAPAPPDLREPAPADPLRDLDMRMTYRTVRVLAAIAARPESSNREVGAVADVQDQGQISKLLTRLAGLGLIENGPTGSVRGGPNAWVLTAKGERIARSIAGRSRVLAGR